MVKCIIDVAQIKWSAGLQVLTDAAKASEKAQTEVMPLRSRYIPLENFRQARK